MGTRQAQKSFAWNFLVLDLLQRLTLGTRLAPVGCSWSFVYQTGSRGPERSFWVQYRFQRSLGTGLALEAPGGNCLVPDWLQRPLTGIFWYLTASVWSVNWSFL